MLLQLQGVRRSFVRAAQTLTVLSGIDLALERGEFVLIGGPSGSGKTTLLQLIGGLDRCTSGSVVVDGNDLTTLDDEQLATYRRRRIGFVFQEHHLLPALTAAENVSLPLLLDGVTRSAAARRAAAELEAVGLAARAEHLPAQLSGGEAQRVAVARALVTRPALVLADEPTGNLDAQAGERVLALLAAAKSERAQAVLLATHDPAAGRFADRCLTLSAGRLHTDRPA